MAHVMLDPGIPEDAVVAIEYRLNGRKFRIDFLVAGLNDTGRESLVIVELKQWTDVKFSALQDHVRTFVVGPNEMLCTLRIKPTRMRHIFASSTNTYMRTIFK